MLIRPLTTLEECRQVAALEKTVWGYADAEDVVPPPVLIVSIKRGGILLGAFDDGGSMRGFVYSMAAIIDGRPTQWSHMLGVMPEMRAAGLGARLAADFTADELRREFRRLAQRYHPDRHGAASAGELESLSRRFSEATDGYRCLRAVVDARH